MGQHMLERSRFLTRVVVVRQKRVLVRMLGVGVVVRGVVGIVLIGLGIVRDDAGLLFVQGERNRGLSLLLIVP